MADLIPTEIWFYHILPNLPAKSVSQLKCVCKAWKTLISDPKFVATHLLHQNQHVILQFFDYYSVDTASTRVTDAVKLNCVPINNIIGSSNGLLLCGGNSDLSIWNPSTRDFKPIPRCPILSPKKICGFGFCYDSSINDANIVRFASLNPDSSVQTSRVDIYSMKSNSWKIVENFDAPFSLNDLIPIGHGCFVNGSIYWVVYNVIRDLKFVDIVGFNIKENKFRMVKLPCRWGSEHDNHRGLMVLGSSLGLYRVSCDQRAVVWRLKEGESDEWIKFIDINVPCFNPNAYRLLKPLCLTRNQKVIFLFYHLPRRSKYVTEFLVIDPVSNEIEKLSIRGISYGHPHQSVAYVESLVSLESISGGA